MSGKKDVVYIVFDDVGFSDFGCYGSEIRTPNIDRLAAGGLRYNNFTVTPLCSPTRACLLTGRNHHTVGMGALANVDLGPEAPSYRGRIEPSAATVAEVLRDEGYGTYAVGKWHLTPAYEISPAGPYDNWPIGKGFSRYYGFLRGQTSQYFPQLTYDNHMIDPPQKPRYHLSEDLVDRAIGFVSDHVSVRPDNPFFLYLAFGAQHRPHHVHQEYIDAYKGIYEKGWDAIRAERFQRQKQLGIIPADAELGTPNPDVRQWNELSDDEKKVFVRFQEAYSGFLTHTDEQIGRLLAFLQETGRLDNTLIVLLADNGASQEGGDNGSFNNSAYFNGIPERLEDHLRHIDEIGGPYSSNNYPKGWAQAGNTPFRFYKQNSHFGGTRVPFIVYDEHGIADKGGVREQFHHAIDVTPTVYDLLGIRPPDVHKGTAQLPLHGVSMAYSFVESGRLSPSTRTTQYFHMKGHRAIVHEGWKAVTRHTEGEPFEDDRWELYHVAEDIAENCDLAEEQPEKLQELREIWWREAGAYKVTPLLDKGVSLFGAVSANSPANRRRMTYYPGLTRLESFAAPSLIDRSYTIDIPIERQSAAEEGVLVAYGDHSSGLTIYVLSNRLHYEYNYLGTIYPIVSERELPVGKLAVRFAFEKSGRLQGNGTLYADGVAVGSVFHPATMPVILSMEGLDVGVDKLSPVSAAYRDRNGFPFTGSIEKVVFELADDQNR
ncbi:arylsulfatase [Paenibacillus hodogayensis]|uniref:Arylsulfatase n=1 Tax=Paenibacillus hodogayensis TaxID=279208 RepID=A0ABV5W714_9BACL